MIRSIEEIALKMRRLNKIAEERQDAADVLQKAADACIAALEATVMALTTENLALKERVSTLETVREAP